MPRKLTEERLKYLMNTHPWNLSKEDQIEAAQLMKEIKPALDKAMYELYEKTEQQLNDAETLASEPRGFLTTNRKKLKLGEWHVKKANQ